MHICFFDKNREWRQEILSVLNTHPEYLTSLLKLFTDYHFMTNKLNGRSIAEKKLPTPAFFVSPANSYGRMDGGLDNAYMVMEFEVEKRAMDYVKQLHHRDEEGRPYNPVGNAFIIPFLNCHYCVSAPTMQYIGTNVSETQNAYVATKATLIVLEKENRLKSLGTLWMPGMGTMVGQMPYRISAQQVLSAIHDFAQQY